MRVVIRLLIVLAILALGAVIAVFISASRATTVGELPARSPDLANGELIFNAGGCSSCHATQGQQDGKRLGGGLALKTPFGVFKSPNISQDSNAGIGRWSETQFLNALLHGTGPSGENLYPVFPYTAYQRLKLDDARDLYAFLKTLPPDPRPSEPHQISFPFTIRLALTPWKALYLSGQTFTPDPALSAQHNRGAYLVEAAAHCAECHSPRNLMGAVDTNRRYSGGPNYDKPADWIPNITPDPDGVPDWSVEDFANLLETGETKDGDRVAGTMAEVVRNTASLPASDRQAMALYIKSLPPRPGKPPTRPNP